MSPDASALKSMLYVYDKRFSKLSQLHSAGWHSASLTVIHCRELGSVRRIVDHVPAQFLWPREGPPTIAQRF